MREREVKEAALRAEIDRLQAEAARLLAARHLFTSYLCFKNNFFISGPAIC
jgi:hypothetical protein